MSSKGTYYSVNAEYDNSHGHSLANAIAQKNIGIAFYLFKSDMPIYKEQSLKNKVCTVIQGTAAKIESIHTVNLSESNNNMIVFGIIFGSKVAYVKFNNLSVGYGGSAEFTTTGNISRIGWLNNTTALPNNIKNNKNYLPTTEKSYENLSSAGKVNESRIKDNIDDEGLEDNQNTTATDAYNETIEAANNSYGGTTVSSDDDDVTREFAVPGNPSYIYNIDEAIAETNRSKSELQGYQANASINGVNYKNIRNIFGAPYQFLPTTDCRISNGSFVDNLELAGYEFMEKIVSRMPLLFMTPGNTSFMGGSTENARTMLLSKIDGSYAEQSIAENSLKAMLEDYSGKLYTIMPAYVEYFNYVNPMCRAGAIFLGIEDKEIYGKKLDVVHWGLNQGIDYKIYLEEDSTMGDDTNEETPENQQDTEQEEPEEEKYNWENYDNVFQQPEQGILSTFQEALYYKNAIPFYINSEASFQDSFSNETTESSLASTVNALSDRAREIQFLLGTASSAVGDAFDRVDGTLTDIKEQINNIVSRVSGGNSIFTTIANSVKTIVSGGRMLFPQIWSNSQFSKTYNISIKLTTPSYDKFSWWLNIYVPLCHLMAFVLPRSEYVNSYTTPFLVKAFYRGMFNIDMGIITEMSFNRGKEGSWTKDGLPTVVDVSFTIQDLYTGMGMTSLGAMFKGTTLQNVSEMDYIANLCGININEPDLFRMARLWIAFNIKDRFADILPNLSLNIGSSIRNLGMNLYGSLWGI